MEVVCLRRFTSKLRCFLAPLLKYSITAPYLTQFDNPILSPGIKTVEMAPS